ncbi:MAG: cell division protein ZapA [Rhodospirillaceae bacterium]|nr:cell division protein ZapA [Rhodospirillaceae bacterium]
MEKKITVSINGRKYDIACDDGQEAHLTRLSQYVDRRVNELVAAVGQVGDARLLVMTSLLLADELSEVYTELDALRGNQRAPSMNTLGAADLEKITKRIENIAEKLEDT